jgi:septum formation protein
MTLRLVLASASPRRLSLLAQIGITPSMVVAADLDESILGGELPAAYVTRLAEAKAQAVSVQHADALVLGADTAVACGRRILPKAEDEKTAADCLRLLSGRSHRVHSAIAVVAPGGILRRRLVTSRVTFKRLDDSETRAYLASGEWQGKAGGYAIQGLAAAFVSDVQGSYSAVVGLPLFETSQILRGLGLRIGTPS